MIVPALYFPLNRGKIGYTIRVTAFYFLCEREIGGVIPGSPKIRIHPGSGLRSG